MTTSRRFKQTVAAIALGMPMLCFAGRPVFHDLTLAELVRTSNIIAVVTQVEPESIKKGEHGCASAEWHLSVVAMIKTSPEAGVKAGDTLDVRRNVTSYQDCVIRGWNATGASFPASRYEPSDSDAPQQKHFIVFLKESNRQFALTADLGFESHTLRPKIERLLRE